MTAKGIVSPWDMSKPKEQSVAEQLRSRARSGQTPVALQGRTYTLLVTLPVSFREAKDADLAARHVVGEFLQDSKKGELPKLLLAQKISANEGDIVGPKVTYDFGNVKLYAAASSSDFALAQAFGIDRIALALTEGRVRFKAIADMMKQHFLEVLRNS